MRKPIVVVTVLALLGALGAVVAVVNSLTGSLQLPRLGPACTVRADGEVTLDSTQMANAATITAVGIRRKMPERAVVIALAGTKQLLRRTSAGSIRADLAELSERSAGYFRSAEGREGVAAFREKRPASWIPR